MNNSKTEKGVFLSGFMAILGPPNVGKSTLLNRILGRKIAIVSPKPQTTRNRILGVFHGEGFQMAFLDTPGIHKTRTPLHKSMVASAKESVAEVDILILVIEMQRPDDPEIPLIIKSLEQTGKPVILVINKIDTGPKKDLLSIMDTYGSRYSFEAVIPVSALKGDGTDVVVKELKKRLKPGPEFFPKDMETDQSESFLISEVIREKIYLYTTHELPYSSAVTVEKIADAPNKDMIVISAVIHVESESQKAIIIGRKGSKIKDIGRSARFDLEKMFGSRVFLDLHTRVEKNWSRDTRALRRLGY